MFSDLTKTLALAFGGTLCKGGPSNFEYALARGLTIHTRFDDLDLVSRSHVCKNHKLQIVSDSCTLVQGCYTH